MVLKGGNPMPARPSKVGLTVSNDARRGAICAMRRPRRTAGAAPDGEQRQTEGRRSIASPPLPVSTTTNTRPSLRPTFKISLNLWR
jgi:hypothetical protein